jgi:hypothetical protein
VSLQGSRFVYAAGLGSQDGLGNASMSSVFFRPCVLDRH